MAWEGRYDDDWPGRVGGYCLRFPSYHRIWACCSSAQELTRVSCVKTLRWFDQVQIKGNTTHLGKDYRHYSKGAWPFGTPARVPPSVIVPLMVSRRYCTSRNISSECSSRVDPIHCAWDLKMVPALPQILSQNGTCMTPSTSRSVYKIPMGISRVMNSSTAPVVAQSCRGFWYLCELESRLQHSLRVLRSHHN